MTAARRKGTPALTTDQIVDAAIRLIDEHGLEHHSMRQLGAALGVDPMAVYYHVPNKAALYDLIVDRVMGDIPIAGVVPGTDHVELLVATGKRWLASLMEHPRLVPLLAVRSVRTPKAIKSVDGILGILYDAGLTPTDALTAVDTFGWYVLGAANAYAANRSGSEYAAETSMERLNELPLDELPNFARLMSEGEYLGFDGEFERGLRALAGGLLAMSSTAS
jgi:TetR/AcrR family transcriptional regulator, tetracycline repressor protein